MGELREWEGDQGVMESGSELAACWGAVGIISTLALPLGEMGVAPCFWRAFLFPQFVALKKVTDGSDKFGRERGSPADAQSSVRCCDERDLGWHQGLAGEEGRSSALECQGPRHAL